VSAARHGRGYRATRHVYLGARRLAARRHAWTGLRILGYHRVSDDVDELAVTPRQFRAQMEALRPSGIEPVRLADISSLDELAQAGRYASVTFDDGYRDNLEHAVPVLRELGIPATVFLPVRILDGTATYRWYGSPPLALRWEEVHALQDEGLVDFQAHTLTHPLLPDLDDASARREIVDGRRELEARLGRTVTSFCYPGGRFGPREVSLVAEAGYRYGVTCLPGVNGPAQPVTGLRRTMIHRDDSLRWFAAKLDGALDARDPLPAALRRLRLLPPAR
jgi:peptidoglycan/xylan/chitin deacetylase (PgdA/CDA1 family)